MSALFSAGFMKFLIGVFSIILKLRVGSEFTSVINRDKNIWFFKDNK